MKILCQIFRVPFVLLTLFLFGCDSPPDASAIGNATGYDANAISDISCAKGGGEPGYTCTYIVYSSSGGFAVNGTFAQGRRTSYTSRFVKMDGGGWRKY